MARNVAADRVKVFLICAVILTHCAITYGADGSWFYREVQPGGVVQVLDLPIGFGELFAMGMFFFLAGSFLPDALARKGTRRFVADRGLRLGVPVLVYVFLIVPGTQWVVATVVGPPESARSAWSTQLHELDCGPMWFAAVLLLFSVIAAAVVGRSPVRPRPLTVTRLACYGALIAVVSFVIRTWFAIDTFQIGSAHLWQWGQCLGLFVLGVYSGRAGLEPVDRRTRRVCQGVLLGCLVVLVVLIGEYAGQLDPFGGGLRWQSAVIALLEAAASVTAPVVLLDLLRPRRRTNPERSRRFAGAAYVAYVAQVPVLVGLALAVREVGLPVTVKFLIVGAASLVACFGLGLTVRRWRWSRADIVTHHGVGAVGGEPGDRDAALDVEPPPGETHAGRDRSAALRLPAAP